MVYISCRGFSCLSGSQVGLTDLRGPATSTTPVLLVLRSFSKRRKTSFRRFRLLLRTLSPLAPAFPGWLRATGVRAGRKMDLGSGVAASTLRPFFTPQPSFRVALQALSVSSSAGRPPMGNWGWDERSGGSDHPRWNLTNYTFLRPDVRLMP